MLQELKKYFPSLFSSYLLRKLKRSFDLKDYLDSIYSEAAQYDHPPTYPLNIVCGGIDGAPKGTDILGRIFTGVVAYMGNKSCYDMYIFNHPTDETYMGWKWQVRRGSYIKFLNFTYCKQFQMKLILQFHMF